MLSYLFYSILIIEGSVFEKEKGTSMSHYFRQPFLHREVKCDSRGLFVFLGGFRYRPPSNTRVKQRMEVCLNTKFQTYYNHEVQVFWNTKEFEIWGHLTKDELAGLVNIPAHLKRRRKKKV